MLLVGYSLSGLIAAAIIFIGARFLWAPAVATTGFGLPIPPDPLTRFGGWQAAKGVRDVASGLFVILLMVHGAPRLLGEFMIVASLIPIGDAVTVLRSGGSKAVAFGIHGLTAVVMIATSAILILTVH